MESDIKVRRVRFDLGDDDIPFLWQPERPAFSIYTNYMSFIAPGFENMIVDATREAIPLMTDPAAIKEANLFLRQEAQHSAAHIRHINALLRRYPGLQETHDEMMASYANLTATKPLMWRLAYTAALENTFTPYFKVYLDHQEKLFAPGDDRVASLFLWHFCEEIEHRSSAMVVYNAVNGSFLYRLKAIGSVVKHIGETTGIVSRGFQKHIPADDGGHYGALLSEGFGMRGFSGARRATKRLGLTSQQAPYAGVPRSEIIAMLIGLIRSQAPHANHKDAKVPEFAYRWFHRYEEDPAGAAHWYGSNTA
ncbi:metal-dependent hydrolase [Mycobacterium sp. 94-17]|uniref:metal-dependent hydrolase n=1 Tax=Mycobacterium sp. 94-17 TaxID=2986147 RepID=UPI002D1E9F4F|nr:metal-dependent hydrolase [Mycobacterium sp. 94-17]MEB4207736.1 metal-dependent hydrolase [Mycobacterium sp. 94-17]